jgi:GPH family glycoside/pentoside/hexuronide:cation symporter
MNTNKINTLGKKLAFASPELNLAITFVTINSWLLYYFVNVVEIPAMLAGVAFLVGRLADAMLDPFIGRLSDRIAYKYGRKCFITWGIVPAGVAYVALWWLPSLSTHVYLQFASACLAFVVFSLFYTLITIPRHAMLPSLVPAYDDRTQQVTFNISFVMLAVLVGIAITPALVLYFSAQNDLANTQPLAWSLTAISFSLVGLLFCIPFVLSIPDCKGPQQKPSSAHLFRDFTSVFKASGFRLLISLLVLSTLATMIVQSMLPFYLESVVRLPGDKQQTMLGAIFVLSILTFPLWAYVGHKIGKARALICGIIIYMAFLVLIPFIPRSGESAMLYLAAVLSGIGISAINLFPWAMLPDCVDEDTLKNKQRREGLVYSVYIFMHKTAGSVGVFSNAIVLSVFNHKAGQIAQGPSTIDAFVWMTGPVPFILFVLAMLVCARYPVTKSSHQLTQQKIIEMESSNATTQQ